MKDPIDQTDFLLSCLHLPESSGFRWALDHSAIERLSDGRTVAFREEVERVVLDLAGDGFTAQMQSVAEAFLAVRDLPAEALSLLDPTTGQDPFFVGHVAVHLLERCRDGLDRRYHSMVTEELARGWPLGADLTQAPIALSYPELPDVRAALPLIDGVELRKRVLTRSERELAPPRLDFASGGSGRTEWKLGRPVPAALRRAPSTEFEAITWMAQSLAAAVRLPIPGAAPQDVAVGGFSDIANRGSLERLLISELGQDDEILAARLVLGEALFLKREASSRPPAPERHVLVDASVRAWGTTRLVQAAAALAAFRGAPAGIACALWIAKSGSLVRVEDVSESGLAGALSELGRAPSCSNVLMEFGERTRETESGGFAERVIVVPRRALRDDELLRAIAALGGCFVIAVDARGHVELRAAGATGQRTLRHATVPVLEPELVQAEAQEPPSARRQGPMPDDLPAYVGVWPGPLLLPHAWDRGRWFPLGETSDHALVLTRSKRVIAWTKRSARPLGMRAGGREVAILPAGHPVYWGPEGGDGLAAIWMTGRRSTLAIARVSREVVPQVAFLLLAHQPKGLVVTDGVFVIGLEDRVVLASPEEGVIREESAPHTLTWRGSCARAKGGGPWRRVAVVNGEVAWKNVVGEPPKELFQLGTPLSVPVDGKRSTDWVERNSMVKGHRRIALDFSDGGLTVLLIGSAVRTIEVPARTVSPRWGSHRDRGQNFPVSASLTPCENARFPAARFLAGGEWVGGWRVWSDRRGLLHFRSPEPALGSLTLALFAEPPFTAWCSLGWELNEAKELRLPMGEPHPLSDWLIRFAAGVVEEMAN